MAKWYKVIESRKEARHVKHSVLAWGNPNPEIYRYVTIRMGLSYPSQEAKGAYVVVGQEVLGKFDAAAQGQLILIDEMEYEGLSLDAFFNKATDAYSLMGCDTMYCDVDNEALYTHLLDYLSRTGQTYVDVLDAPYKGDFYGGLAVCNDWHKSGKLDLCSESLTRAQLRSITKDDLDHEPEARFPLVNALRHCLSGYKKYAPVPPLKMGRTTGESGPQGWMAY